MALCPADTTLGVFKDRAGVCCLCVSVYVCVVSDALLKVAF